MKTKVFLFFSCFFLCLFFCSGCAPMRDYTYKGDGFFGLRYKKGFGPGGEQKDYYITQDKISLIIGDTKTEVLKKIGSPDKIEKIIGGEEVWNYEDRNLNLFFREDFLKQREVKR